MGLDQEIVILNIQTKKEIKALEFRKFGALHSYLYSLFNGQLFSLDLVNELDELKIKTILEKIETKELYPQYTMGIEYYVNLDRLKIILNLLIEVIDFNKFKIYYVYF